jgi:hypothetical protein
MRQVLHPALCAIQINPVHMDPTLLQDDKAQRLRVQEHLMDLLGRLSLHKSDQHKCFHHQRPNNSNSSSSSSQL